MGRKAYGKRRNSGQFLQLYEWVLRTEAWLSLDNTARSLYIELKRRFRPHNNGKITLSHREAAKLLKVSKNTVGKYYRELQDKGFIEMTVGPCLGPSGVGQTAQWLLTEEPSWDGQKAKKTFASWRPE